ncbi:MAG: hypothetical protein H6812_01080 [Phycisphaeraceae bacterium]|nr:hypothetical protein [Phycisphaerales bacterium]MCB9841827.1 hypothetical protein [Phycisphaeraceae bacterium]
MSTFQALDLFGSGPHRFVMDTVGRYTEDAGYGPTYWPNSQDRGKRELRIKQEGRLVASSEAGLWTLIDAIRAKAELPATGTLNDGNGRSWPGMTMVRFTLESAFDRGRVFSVMYSVRYYKLS